MFTCREIMPQIYSDYLINIYFAYKRTQSHIIKQNKEKVKGTSRLRSTPILTLGTDIVILRNIRKIGVFSRK